MWNNRMQIPENTPKENRVMADGVWAGASWNGPLNVGMHLFKKRTDDRSPKSGYRYFFIRDYTPDWKIIAALEIERIKRPMAQTSWFVDIQHIGSTSIPNMAAKPIVDLMLGYDPYDQSISEKEIEDNLTALGYTKSSGKFWCMCVDNYLALSIVVVQYNSLFWKSRVLFRDYFLEHQDETSYYMTIKKNLKGQGVSFDEYVKGKQRYISKILMKQGMTKEEMIGNVYNTDPDDTSISIPRTEWIKVNFDNWRPQ